MFYNWLIEYYVNFLCNMNSQFGKEYLWQKLKMKRCFTRVCNRLPLIQCLILDFNLSYTAFTLPSEDFFFKSWPKSYFIWNCLLKRTKLKRKFQKSLKFTRIRIRFDLIELVKLKIFEMTRYETLTLKTVVTITYGSYQIPLPINCTNKALKVQCNKTRMYLQIESNFEFFSPFRL